MQNLRRTVIWAMTLALLVLMVSVPAFAQDDMPLADIINDEGGPVVLQGEMAYTNPFLTAGTSEPLIILEDQGGFVERDHGFRLPLESQALAQITSDFFVSPFSYSLALPIVPQGSLRDVDNDGEEDTGVQIYVVAYWSNIFGDPFLEERDLFGAPWSTAYTSVTYGETPSTAEEITGGKMLIYAPDDEQGFPIEFGEDGLLFTGDEDAVRVPQGYTIVDISNEPFTFDRTAEPTIDLLEPESTALADFSDLSYTEAFDAMIEKMSREYAFTEYKGIDWDALVEEFRPRFEEAEQNRDSRAYSRALVDFTWSIPDGHVGTSIQPIADQFFEETGGSMGFAMRTTDDGRVIASFVTAGAPAAEAGMELGAEIIEIGGRPVEEVIAEQVPWSSPFSTDHNRRLQQERYATRLPLGTETELTFQNPDADEPTTVAFETVSEQESWQFSAQGISQSAGLTGFELPVEYEVLEDGIVYAEITSFFDDERLTVSLWERMIETMRDSGSPGLIVDMRQNGGGSPFLANQLAAFFFDEPLVLGNAGRYDADLDDFFFDDATERQFFLPPVDQRYFGPVAVLVGPTCASACESFSYAMSIQDRAAIVGQYPTAGLGGGIEAFLMPEGSFVQFTVTRNVDADGNIHIEGIGVVPTVDVPVNEETLFAEGDPVLDAAVEYILDS